MYQGTKFSMSMNFFETDSEDDTETQDRDRILVINNPV
jgi:hypothetical protein